MTQPAHSPRRGALMGATAFSLGAVGAAVAAPSSNAEQSEAELLAMGRERDALATEEQAASATEDLLYRIAEQRGAAPSPALLAYSHSGEPLFRPLGTPTC